jgi:hypothetical protein
LHAACGELIQMGSVGSFQLGLAAWLERQSAQTIRDEHDDFGIVLDLQLARQLMYIHQA